MPRTRTSPESQPAIDEDRVVSFRAVIGYDDQGDYDPNTTHFEYAVNNLANGQVIDSQVRRIDWNDIPAAAQSDLVDVFNRVLADAEAQGLIGAGTDSGDPA